MISGAHVTVFAQDAEAARAFFRDVLGFPSVDAGDGWLIFAAPRTEVGLHPGAGWGQAEGQHMLFLMCDDIERTVEDLKERGVEFLEAITDEGFGPLTRFRIPGAGEIGLYQPTYPSPFGGSSPES
jgi:catechol 2,3-dioxygenase-like lactoylglutathione lyase family enzyme